MQHGWSNPDPKHLLRILRNWKHWTVQLVIILSLTIGIVSPAWAENYNRFSLVGADFSNQDLRDDDFTKANLREANFQNSNLIGVRFFAANLEAANLRGADLRNATLDSARLVNADLTNARLEGAFAASINVPGITITGADFTDVLLRPDTLNRLCAIASGVNPITGRETRETLMCP